MRQAASVLVVDDDTDIVANMRDILAENGYRADAAHDGAAALELVRHAEYRMALLDYQMPDMDGATLFNRIRMIQPQLRAIMVTADAASDGVARAEDAGTWRVLQKPIDMGELLGMLDQALEE